MRNKSKKWPTWYRDDKTTVSCTEKIKVMAENFDEIQQITQDAFEDGLLMLVPVVTSPSSLGDAPSESVPRSASAPSFLSSPKKLSLDFMFAGVDLPEDPR